MKIGVIGIGKLGLSFSLLAENKGFEVIGSDFNQSYIDSLNNRTYKTDEPLIEEYLEVSRKIQFTTHNSEIIRNTDLIFTFVATPSLPDGDYDHTFVDMVVNDFIDLSHQIDLSNKTFVIGCTVNPGYTDTVQEKLNQYGISN